MTIDPTVLAFGAFPTFSDAPISQRGSASMRSLLDGAPIVVTLAGMLTGQLAFGAESGPSTGELAETAADAGPVAVETYNPPTSLDLVRPTYPRAQSGKGREGWVHLNFMVDTQGRPYEITVADAVGGDQFREAAIRALERSQFVPATLDGVPIESSANYGYSFEMQGAEGGVRRRFARRYRNLVEAVEAGEHVAADAALDSLNAENLFENAYLQFAMYRYYRQWGNSHQQLAALHRAVGRDESSRRLSDDAQREALRNLLALQMDLKDFGGALRTAARLRELSPGDEFAAALDRAVEELESLREVPGSFAVAGLIDDGSYSWHLSLFRRNFRIDQVTGRLAEIKLRCAGKYVGFRYREDLVYQVSERYMPCDLEVIGDPGTEFRLLQINAQPAED